MNEHNLMQETFLKKLMLSLIVAAAIACVVEFYKTFVQGADEALNGKHGTVHMHIKPSPTPVLR